MTMLDTRLAPTVSPPLQPEAGPSGMGAVALHWVPATDWDAIQADWRRLAASGEGPVFLAPAFALAARTIDPRDLGAFVVTRDGAWIGLVAGRFGLRGSLFSLWTHPYAPSGGMMTRPGEAATVMGAVMVDLARRGVAALHWPMADDATWSAAAPALAGRAVAVLDSHRRAVLITNAPPLSKDHRRLARRLAETGRLETVSTATGHDIDKVLDAYLALEAEGWKGRAGTAMAGNPVTASFFRAAVGGLARAGQARIDLMLCDDRPIAAGVVLRSGVRAWYWKTAYDEAFARYSPGLLLSHAIGEATLAEPGIALVDSCAVQGHPMIDRIWPERMAITSRLVAVQDGSPGWRFHAVVALKRGLIDAKARAKRLLKR
ncbi:GNAT family N-acetyltransferase [Phreatobacter oligotrophus]|uniref:CelD/BcsL family acetyltransferase involved in cellulose biosynthesis n=1 Tax=Phreatobacter oligotrophus TaxID=1122261 RepID=A0A2T4YZU7_9HYPH|nr:GNAT family N-acetyltransferase [Phreatobacter oligotrophus]PTM52760.1 CelD/BcsL family acetyltransferase involved in cellulose biosynthesis [Phreatobacter oligotrophus]